MASSSLYDLQALQVIAQLSAAYANASTPGTLKPVVDSVFECEDALKAYERIMTSRAKGKVVVKVDPEAE